MNATEPLVAAESTKADPLSGQGLHKEACVRVVRS